MSAFGTKRTRILRICAAAIAKVKSSTDLDRSPAPTSVSSIPSLLWTLFGCSCKARRSPVPSAMPHTAKDAQESQPKRASR